MAVKVTQFFGQINRVYGGNCADSQGTGNRAAGGDNLFHQHLFCRQQSLRRLNKCLPGGGQPDPARSTLKQCTAQLLFQFGDLVAERRLHRMTALRRPGKTLLFGNRQRKTDLFQVHSFISK